MALDSTFSPVLTSLLPLDVYVCALVSFSLFFLGGPRRCFTSSLFLFYMDNNSAGARKAKRRTIADINAGIAGLAKTTPATEADAHDLAAQEQGAGGPSSGRQSEALQQVLRIARLTKEVEELTLELVGCKAEIKTLKEELDASSAHAQWLEDADSPLKIDETERLEMGHKVAALKKEKLAEELAVHKLPVHESNKSHDVATCLYRLPLRALLVLAGLAGQADSAVSRPAPFLFQPHMRTAPSRPYKVWIHTCPSGNTVMKQSRKQALAFQLLCSCVAAPLPPTPHDPVPSQVPNNFPQAATPGLRAIADSMGLSQPARAFSSRRALIMTDASVLSPDMRSLRSAAIASASRQTGGHAVAMAHQPQSSSMPESLQMDTKRKESAFHRITAYINSCPEWVYALFGGEQAYMADPPQLRARALRRHLEEKTGNKGDNLHKLCDSLDFCVQHKIHTRSSAPLFPLSAAMQQDAAEAKMQNSKSVKQGKPLPTSVPSRFIASLQWGRKNLFMPAHGEGDSPLLKSVTKHVPKDDGSTEPVPFYLIKRSEFFSLRSAPAHCLFYVYVWNIMVLSSTRSVDQFRSTIFSKFVIPAAALVMNIRVTKSGVHNTKFALPAHGFFYKLPWLQGDYQQLVSQFGHLPTPFDSSGKLTLDIARCASLSSKQLTSEQHFTDIVLSAFRLSAGISEADRIAVHVTGHSPHAVMLATAEAFRHRNDVRKAAARHSLGTQDTYVKRASCENQLTIRSFIMSAFLQVTGGVVPEVPGSAFISNACTKELLHLYGTSAV